MTRFADLTAKVDAFFARVEARHAEDMQCTTGCSDCCHVRLTITGVEADAIASEVASWPVERRRALLPAVDDDRCAALDAAGRCRIYAARPLVCRSHGVPIRIEARSLPVVQACHRNFTRHGPAAADADCILDQTTLSAMLLAVDRDSATLRGAFDREAGGDPSQRVDLASLLATLAMK